MKILYSLLFLALAPTTRKYRVTYEFEKNVSKDIQGKKTLTKYVITPRSGEVYDSTAADSTLLTDILPELILRQNYIIVGDRGLSSIVTQNSRFNNDFGIRIHDRDSMFFNGQSWYIRSEGGRKKMNGYNLQVDTVSNTIKTLLGYPCFLVKAHNNATGERFEIWATKQLPSTFNPIIGACNLPFGIVTVKEISGRWSAMATKVEVL